jgi:hypothetical protein
MSEAAHKNAVSRLKRLANEKLKHGEDAVDHGYSWESAIASNESREAQSKKNHLLMSASLLIHIGRENDLTWADLKRFESLNPRLVAALRSLAAAAQPAVDAAQKNDPGDGQWLADLEKAVDRLKVEIDWDRSGKQRWFRA